MFPAPATSPSLPSSGFAPPWSDTLTMASRAGPSRTDPSSLDLAPLSLRRAGEHDADAVLAHLASTPELSFCPRWESGKIREMLRQEAPIVVAEMREKVIGLGTAGIHGMRGIIHHLSVHPEHRSLGVGLEIVRELLSQLQDRGVRRIHTFVDNNNSRAREFFGTFGFCPQMGERLLQRDLVSPFDADLSPRPIPHGLTLRKAGLADLSPLLRTLEPVPELAFQTWEQELLAAQLRNPATSIFLVATNSSGDYVGALIGGHHGLRGTINHLWVAEGFRECGIGRLLLQQSLRDFESAQVKRLHIMLTPGNERGYAFWSKVHFREIPGETFLEVDV